MQTPAPAEIQRIALLIEAEAIQLREFLDHLQREEALLVSGDTEGLLALTTTKTERYRQLQRLHDDRALLLGRLGLPNKDASIRQVCAQLPRVLARWDEVIELAREARTRNELNGKLINERMQHNQAALSVLLSAANHPQLYDADGQSRPSGGGRILGSA
ncbi:MAG: flagellar protein FlgN [Betaproteobacteria bacterium HGW-Betaproteobacteria-13]|jgi:flagella synthesis protein FlgN|nr:MAG: flagellar protein FlgN [Betaproteobacteria bacterium HGW-Betaproteobacteria-19]PKO79366.1 MAG: flagellar protein FlgN [Betaproteobacteria bacterium HGW-Betaproteobacteria-13]